METKYLSDEQIRSAFISITIYLGDEVRLGEARQINPTNREERWRDHAFW